MKIEMIGKKFGRLMVLEGAGRSKRSEDLYRCECECGVCKIIRGRHLRARTIKSCGCLSAEMAKERATTHGMTKTPTFSTWLSMQQRCTNPNHPSYKYYGDRGITVCNEWKKSFSSFLKDMGIRPKGTSIDRFPNNNGNYEPGNCRWATPQEQCRNRRLRNDNKTGAQGIYWHKVEKKYHVSITSNHIRHNIGYFVRLEDARAARRVAESKYWGVKCQK